MRRDPVMLTMGFVDDCAEFVESKRWTRVQYVVMNPAATIGIDLYPIRAMGKLFPHCLARTLHAIHRLHSNRHRDIPCIRWLQWIRASYVHGTPHYLHTRPPDQPAVNGIAHVNIGVAGSLRLKIADSSEAPIQGRMRSGRR